MKNTRVRSWGFPLALAAFAFGSAACRVEAGPPVFEASDDVVVEAPPPPPPPVAEVIVAPPGPDYFWVGGYHRWEGRRYVWVRGRYERRPHPAARWEPAHWQAHPRGRVWVEGRWR